MHPSPMQRLNHPHPGNTLRDEVIAPLGLSIEEFANQLGVSAADLERVANGRSSITGDLAQKLEGAGFSTTSFWLRLQAEYDREKLAGAPVSVRNPPLDLSLTSPPEKRSKR